MRNLKALIFILFLCIVCIFSNSVYASNIKKYTYETEEVNKSTDKFINIGTNYFNKPSTVYDFFDETGAYNVVYTSETNVYWATFDDEMNIVNTRKMPMIYDKSNTDDSYLELTTNFGNAIYYNEHLFVIYGREHYASSYNGMETQEELQNFIEYPTMAVVKYNKDGVEVARNELAGTHINYFTDWSDGTYLPFFPNSGCSLAINNNGILACFFGKTQFEAHQMSTLFFIDTEDLRWVSNRYKSSQEDLDKYLTPTEYYNSHSMFTRIIATEDNGFIFADSGDASKRGITIGKIFEDINLNLNLRAFRTVHYREGAADTYGYNNTYCTPGNFIEVSDGYLFIGSLEKTLSRQYGDSINEPWNIFVQKYKKDMQNETQIQNIQVFTQEEQRVAEGEPSEYNGYGRLYLKGDEIDYGIKWLTDLESSIVINLKAIKADNENIILLWEELPYSLSKTGINTLDSKVGSNYYMIIDKDANILTPRTKINKDISLTTEEKYVYRDNKVYWTSCTGWNTQITVNVLNFIDNSVKSINTDVNALTLDKGTKKVVNVSINPIDTTDEVNISWSSNNQEVAVVNEITGEIAAKEVGNAIITCTVKASNNETTKTYTSNIPVTVVGSKPVKSIKLSDRDFELTKGHKHDLSVIINPSDTTDITKISWSSANPNVATVDEKTGTVTAIKEGTSIIAVTVDCYDTSGKLVKDFSKHLTVTVTGAKKVKSITTNTESLKLNLGDVSNLSVTLNPEDTTDIITTTWKSSNPSVVSVDKLTGKVTALSGGNAVITCTVVAKDDITTNTFTKNINVVVPEERRPVTKIDVNTQELTLKKNNTSTLSVNITPNNTTDKVSITWSSLNKNIADVDKSTGLVTAKSKGETTVTCTVVCNDGTRTVTYTKDVKIIVTDNSNPPSNLKGDMDKNGVINGTDASIVLDIYNKNNVTEEELSLGDMDNNGILNGTDAAMILDIYNKVL